MKVIFAIASYFGKITAETVVSMEETRLLLNSKDIEHGTIYAINKTPAANARNYLTDLFMNMPDATDLFFIDDDVVFPADAVAKLLERPELVIGGAYPIKDENEWHYACRIKTEDDVPIGRDGLIECDGLSGGFLRIKREVIEKMYNYYKGLEYYEWGKRSFNIWGNYIDNNKILWGEDYAFSNRWREIGGRLWLYPNIDFEHIGKKSYKGNYYKYLENLALSQKG